MIPIKKAPGAKLENNEPAYIAHMIYARPDNALAVVFPHLQQKPMCHDDTT
jgi:hypothetical protein